MTIHNDAQCAEAEAQAAALRSIFDQIFNVESNCRDSAVTHPGVADILKTAEHSLEDAREALGAEMSDVETAIKEWRRDDDLVGQGIRPRAPRPATVTEQQRDAWRTI